MNRFTCVPTTVVLQVVTSFVAAMLFSAGPVWAEAEPDPVEKLREVLKWPVKKDATDRQELQFRREELEKRVKALRPADLATAVGLHEWRDEDTEEAVAAIDRTAREAVARRFAERMRAILKGDDTAGKLAALTLIGEMGVTVRAIGSPTNLTRVFAPDLISAMKDRDPSVVAAAAKALGKVKPPPKEAAAALDKLLGAADVAPRRAAAEALTNLVRVVNELGKVRGTFGIEATASEAIDVGRSVAPVAGRCLGDADPLIRRNGLEALRLAAHLLNEQVADLSEDGILSPGRKPTETDRPDIEAYVKILEEERALLLPLTRDLAEHIPVVTRTLADADLSVALAACEALEALPSPRRRLLQKAKSAARFKGEDVAKMWSDPLGPPLRQAVPNVAALTTHKDVRVRLGALYVLEELEGDAAPAADALVKCLADGDPFVRWAAVRALGKMAPREPAKAVPGLAKTLADENGDVRVTAVAALGRFGASAKEAVPALAKVVQGDEAELRVLAIQALGGVGPEAKPAVPALIAALSAPEVEVRAEAARALGKLGAAARSALEALRKALDDPAEDVRQAASEAVLAIK